MPGPGYSLIGHKFEGMSLSPKPLRRCPMNPKVPNQGEASAGAEAPRGEAKRANTWEDLRKNDDSYCQAPLVRLETGTPI